MRFAAVGRIGALVAALKRRVDALLGALWGVFFWGSVSLVCGGDGPRGVAPSRGCRHHSMAKM